MAEVQSEEGKIAKVFDKNMRTLIALLAGESLLKNTKVEKDQLDVAMEELAREEKETKTIQVKEKIRNLIKEKRDFDQFVKAKKKEFEKAIEEKQKEFNQKAEGVFKDIEDIRTIETSYYETLRAASAQPGSTE